MPYVLVSLIIIQNIINVCCVGLIVGSECVPFDSISLHPDAYNQSHQVGWVKVISCIDSSHSHTVNPFTFYRSDYLSLSSRAISIKFQPPGGVNNPHYASLTVIAKPYTNPIQYGLNYAHELSYTYNASGNVAGMASTSNWIGTKTALSRLNQGDCPNAYKGNPYKLHEMVYHACANVNGLHIFPNRNGTIYYKCKWEHAKFVYNDIEIYFGFAPEDCVTESPSKSSVYPTSIHPTKYPTISPTNNPS